ncbi:MAG: STAS/SEC14 domain-containing protein [Mycobacteriaceae bacterium]
MIEILTDFPDDVAGYSCHDRLTKSDYAAVMRDVEDKLTRHDKLNMYCEVSPDYSGAGLDAAWEDWKSSFSTWFHWERGAIVTDVEWMVWATRFFGMLFPGEWRIYPPDRAAQARRWVIDGTETAKVAEP